tara:strand:- start:273 stop:437 length:165 start_codon:yes stop_codon:yes gene_type:complete
MTIGGWIIMTISVGGVTGLFAWTLALILTRENHPEEHMHSTLDEPPDLDRPRKR